MGAEFLQKFCPASVRFCDNRPSDTHTTFSAIHTFLPTFPIFPTFYERFGEIRHNSSAHNAVEHSLSFVKISDATALVVL
jgi:hypothetical protein